MKDFQYFFLFFEILEVVLFDIGMENDPGITFITYLDRNVIIRIHSHVKFEFFFSEGYTEGFRQFLKQATKVYEVMFFDM